MKKAQMHDTTLTIRLPKALHLQFEEVANAQYMKMGELIRQLMKEEVRKASPYLSTTTPAKDAQIIRKGKVIIGGANPKWDAMSPAERQAYNADWDY